MPYEHPLIGFETTGVENPQRIIPVCDAQVFRNNARSGCIKVDIDGLPQNFPPDPFINYDRASSSSTDVRSSGAEMYSANTVQEIELNQFTRIRF